MTFCPHGVLYMTMTGDRHPPKHVYDLGDWSHRDGTPPHAHPCFPDPAFLHLYNITYYELLQVGLMLVVLVMMRWFIDQRIATVFFFSG